MKKMNKHIILLFIILSLTPLLAFDYYFGINDGAVKVSKNQKIDIELDDQPYKVTFYPKYDSNETNESNYTDTINKIKNIDDERIDEEYIKGIVFFTENNGSGESIPFLIDTPESSIDGNPYIMTLTPQHAKSNQKYLFQFKGSRVQDNLKNKAEDKNISFTMANFLDIQSPKMVHIGLSQSKTFNIKLNKSPSSNDVVVALKSDSEDIILDLSSITLSSLNYMKGIDVGITSTDKISLDKNYNITAKSSSIDASNIIKIVPKEVNVSYHIKQNIGSFDKNISQTFSVKMANPIFNDYNISLVSDKPKVILSKTELAFTRANYDIYQEINISTSSIIKETNATITLSLGDVNQSFNIQVLIPKVIEKEKPIVKKDEITIKEISSIWVLVSWSYDKNYEGNFTIYKGTSLDNLNSNIIGETNESSFIIQHSVNTKYAIGVQYKKTKTALGKIEIPAQRINLTDSNKNGLSDNLEKLFMSNVNNTDSNSDGVPDIVQQYLAAINQKTNINTYTLYNDTDGDKVPDIFELNVGRNPTIKDFNGDKNLVLTTTEDGKNVVIAGFHELTQASGVSSNKNNINLEAYVGDACLKNNILISNYLYQNDCKNIRGLNFKAGNYNVLWVGLDAYGNLDYKKQVLSVTKKVNTGGAGNKKIIFHTCEVQHSFCFIDFTIRTISKYVSFGDRSAGKNQKNPILFEDDILASRWEFTNNIFDLKIGTNTQPALVLLSQAKAIKSSSNFRILRNNAWRVFDTSNGDKISSSKSTKTDCQFDNVYKNGVNEGDLCIKLEIKDGGINDSDGQANGYVSLIGGVSNKQTQVIINDEPSTGCSSLHAGGFDNTKKANIDYLMVFMFLISSLWVIKMFKTNA